MFKDLTPEQAEKFAALLTDYAKSGIEKTEDPSPMPDLSGRRVRIGQPMPAATLELISTTPGFSLLRAWPLLVSLIALGALIWWTMPAKIFITSYGLMKLVAFALAAVLIDQTQFPNDDPETLEGIEQGTAWKRRGLMIAAGMIASGLLQ
jgi:hypothetical protein